MVMAIFERVGGREAVFHVVPLLGGLAVWATYLMGASLAGRTVGLSAAVLLATSPTFLIQLVFPMSDVPVTAWWALALALLLPNQRRAAVASGLAAGAAILTRPNLVPLAALPGALLVWGVLRERSFTGLAGQRALLFAAGAIPACLIVAIINARLYGSPLSSGYGSLQELYGWKNLLPNLARYPRWLLETQTAVVLAALVAPFVVKSRPREGTLNSQPRAVAVMWLLFVVAVFLSYLFYLHFDGWFWLRFILPAFPPLFTLTAIGLVAMLARWDRRARLLVMAAVIGALAWHGIEYSLDQRLFDLGNGERRSVAVGNYIANTLPTRAVFLSMYHSGSIRYYSARLTVRYDWIPQDRLDAVISDLRHLGYHPYLVLEDWEEAQFRAQFQGHSALAALNWPPIAWVDTPIKTKIYDPADAQMPGSNRRVTTATIR
jgi:4-amino-4-deoxy-L-arabinose transferase-like glycosyltransferase